MSGTNSEWHLLNSVVCDEADPAAMIALGRLVGQPMVTRDVKEKGQVVATTLIAPDGSAAKFYRGKARCQAALREDIGNLDRYR